MLVKVNIQTLLEGGWSMSEILTLVSFDMVEGWRKGFQLLDGVCQIVQYTS